MMGSKFGDLPESRLLDRAQRARSKGDHQLSLRICKEALSHEPNGPEVLNLAGVVCCELAGQNTAERQLLLDEAIGYFQRAVTSAPNWPSPQLSLGFACEERGRPLAAARAFRAALGQSGIGPNDALEIGSALARLGCEDDAEAVLRDLINSPVAESAILALSEILRDRSEHDKAIELLRHLVRLRPRSSDAHCALGISLSEIGDFGRARLAFGEALRLDPSHPGANYRLALITQYHSRDRHVRALQEIVTHDTINDDRKLHAHFALGKAFDNIGEPEVAFHHWNQANQLYRKKYYFDINQVYSFYDRIISVFSPEFFDARSDVGVDSDAPTFVIGLPRSGTSLVEQILARHKDVVAAGELEKLKQAMKRTLEKYADADPFPTGIEALDAAAWNEMAEDYLVQATPPDSTRRFVDKAPLNAIRVPVIALAFPNANIIHCVRDPRDLGLSLYQQDFMSESHYYCYDLVEVGQYIRLFNRFMRYWRERLPHRIIEVSYDSLVADPENQIRRLVNLCGLDWDEECLKTNSSAVIRTASLWQARQPIFTSSSGRWQKYELQLQPMLQSLGDEVT